MIKRCFKISLSSTSRYHSIYNLKILFITEYYISLMFVNYKAYENPEFNDTEEI